MCGIIGVATKNKQAISILLEGLEHLQYRGYDSAGIAFIHNDGIQIIKSQGQIEALKQEVDLTINSNLGIGHTRWATHGRATTNNAHPHQCGKITIVHNGIIENYLTLKEELQQKGYVFQSDTDTEVACALLDDYYAQYQDMKQTIRQFMKAIQGSYAIAAICMDEPNTIYAIKKDSPLLIGTSSNQNFIASDIQAILMHTNHYYLLDDLEFAIITADSTLFYNQDGIEIMKEEKEASLSANSASKACYEHYMLKEIYEQPTTLKATIETVTKLLKTNTSLLPRLASYKRIDIVACGTAMHAGLVGKYLLETYAHIPVSVELASEYRYKQNFLDPQVLVIIVSQSGETADSLAALKMVKEKHIPTLGIVNVVDSCIARSVDYVIYTQAGPEIAVASTKAYTAQVICLSLLAFSIAKQKNLLAETQIEMIEKDFEQLPELISALLANRDDYKQIATNLYSHSDIFYLGRGLDYALMQEGSLKLKEISYIHSECYPAGELKHGTISLITENTPVIASATNSILDDKTISNLKETAARGAPIYLITNNVSLSNDPSITKYILLPSTTDFVLPILVSIPLQLIAYETALVKGCSIDKPRNLAKSVTVE